MKNLVEFLNEDININESFGRLSLLAASVFFTAIMREVSAKANLENSSEDTRLIFQIIKDDIDGFFENKKLKKIAEKYKDDEEIQKYVKNPNKKGWKKMLENKLEQEELRYIDDLTKMYFFRY